MAPGARSKFGTPMFEPEVFRKQIYFIKESTCDIVGTFRRPIVIRRPENCSHFAHPSLRPLLCQKRIRMFCWPWERLTSGSSGKALGRFARVRCWRPPDTGRQIIVFLLRSLCRVSNHNRLSLVLDSDTDRAATNWYFFGGQNDVTCCT